ncbi:MAG: rhodanese-like domain-containing protein [Acidobacteriota bacterium]
MIRSISPQDLETLVRAGLTDPEVPGGTVRLFDMRAADAFLTAHIPGSRHTPHSQAERWIPQRASTGELVILIDDDGATEGLARETAAELAHRWFRRVRFIAGGFAAYRAAGFAVESGGSAGSSADSHEGATAEKHHSTRVDWATTEAVNRPRIV